MSSATLFYSGCLVSLHRGAAFCSVGKSPAFPNFRKSKVPVLFSCSSRFPDPKMGATTLFFPKARNVAAAAASSGASFPPWLPPWLQWLDRMIMAFKPIAERYNFFVEFFNNLLGMATQSSEILVPVMFAVTVAVLRVIRKLVGGKKKE